MALVTVLDAALDRSVVLGYTKLGSALRSRWWPDDPSPQALIHKHVLVTGATSGIGEAMGRAFADLGADVHLLGRSRDKLGRVAAELRTLVPNARIGEEVCDVSDLAAIRAWAADFAGRVPVLHGLVHNAGVMTDQRRESAQGHELQLATHVLGPHLMTELLLDPLRAGPGSVVWMSSGGMYGSKLYADEAGLESRTGSYKGVQAYARTKRMQVVLADAWATRLTGTQVKVESMHPGWVDTPGVVQDLPRFHKLTRPLLRTAADGADTAVWLVARRPAGSPHHFWHDRAQRPTTFGWQRSDDVGQVRRFLGYVTDATGTTSF